MKIIKLILFLLLPAVAIGQAASDTLDFDYLIQTDRSDRFAVKPSRIVIDSSSVFIALPGDQFVRMITGKALSDEGEEMLLFANGDGIRLTTFAGSVTGCFVVNRKKSFYLGKDKSLADRQGWTNRSGY